MTTHNGQTGHAPPILLTIAGFDPSCGAGTAADLKTFAAHNCYGVAAVTALTVQSTQGVVSVHATPSATLRAQLDTLMEDIEIAGVKIGMLANRANASVVTEFLDKHKFAHVVLDPVFRPTAGNAELLDTSGLKFVRDELLKRVSVITPNVPEAEFLTGLEVKDLAGMKVAGLKLVEMGAQAVVVTRRTSGKTDGCAVHRHGSGNVRRRPREKPEHARIGLHIFIGDSGATGGRIAIARSRDSGEGIRDQGDREILRDWQRRRTAESTFQISSGAAAARSSRSAAARHAPRSRTHRALIAKDFPQRKPGTGDIAWSVVVPRALCAQCTGSLTCL